MREALWFSARLRLGPQVSNADCARFISEVWHWTPPPPLPVPLPEPALPASLRAASANCSAFVRCCLKLDLLSSAAVGPGQVSCPLRQWAACGDWAALARAQVMALVELTPLASALVGLPGVSGLSVEQRKRLTLAVELVANPAIVFMCALPSSAAHAGRCLGRQL